MVAKFPRVYPLVAFVDEPHRMAVDQFLGSQPHGVTVHYTADNVMKRTVEVLREKKYGYHLIIDHKGKVHQTCWLDKSVNHAGKALWNHQSPNRMHLAVAILNWGELKKERDKETGCDRFLAWNGDEVPADQVRRAVGNVGTHSSYWHKATAEQEQTLMDILRFCMAFGMDPNNVCGHDECALPPGRKVDPGGSLSHSLREIRYLLKASKGK